jgi:hypothetical protein
MKYILRFILFMMVLSPPVSAKQKQPHVKDPAAAAQSTQWNRPEVEDLDNETTPAKPSNQEKSTTPEGADQEARPPETNLFLPGSPEPVLSQTAGPEDPLKVGGVFYLRMLSDARQGQGIRDFSFSTPMLVDTYLDARPNDRVHAELVGRITYDPTGNSYQNIMMNTIPTSTTGSSSTSSSSSSPSPQFILNQLWIRFDIARTVFVAAGKQNIKWGASHFWNPTDFLQPVRNPLEPFDVRTGTTMLKFHLPWEKLGWNFYAVALLEKPKPLQSLIAQTQNSSSTFTTFTLGNLGGAVRAEFVFSTFEIGADFVARDGQRPKYGFDMSAGLDSLLHLPIDIYAEVALRHGSDTTRYRPVAVQPYSLIEIGETHNPNKITPQVSCGLSWSTLYNDQDQIIVGGEYFYNSLGYSDNKLYPWLIANGVFQPFYLGKHYAALYVSLPNPGSWDNTTFTLSGIGNLSDSSFVIRLDYSVLVLTYLKIEAYVAGYLGAPGGEFHFKINTTALHAVYEDIPLVNLPVPIIDVGLSLRIDI